MFVGLGGVHFLFVSHELGAEIFFRGQRIMGPAAKAKIGECWRTSAGMGLLMVQF
jgi:hypothetical protein